MKINYRPEIDGLRAIAVIAVIVYHIKINILNYEILSGGFVGVDIFFVISGYLITLIILKELYLTGTFSFKQFYERRVRRILPALLVVMLVSLPFAWIYLIPNSFVDFSKSIIYSLLFNSNFYFWSSGQEYGADSGLLKAYLHTWSLSVEEQFYIIFPIFLLLIFKFLRKYIIYFFILGFITSLFVADWGSKNYPFFNFYILPTRGWEILAGSILAYYEHKRIEHNKNQILNLLLSTIGLLLILYSIIFFNEQTFHPSFQTLFPIVGVCLVIWFTKKDGLVGTLLSSKIFVWIGLISYSLYLWHYPIFSFDRIIGFSDHHISRKIFLVISLFLVSFCSYYFVEKPARDKSISFRKIFKLIIFSYSVLIMFNLSVIFSNGYHDRLPNKINKHLLEKPWKYLKDKDQTACYGKKGGCKFNTESEKNIYCR